MPNWCSNTATISHKSPTKMARIISAVADNELFQRVVPEPDIMPEGWYEWRLENWGTKWPADDVRQEVFKEGMETHLSFDTAWGPPIEIYEALRDQGYEVDASFYEPNMEIDGYWNNKKGEGS